MFTSEQVRNTFTAWAPRYDAIHGWSWLKRREARLALGVQPGDRVLEVACGTGLNFPHLRQLIGDQGSLIGVDLTPAMLDIARQRIRQNGWKNIEAREADAAHLTFPDESFDKAFSAYALRVIPEYERALAEIKRVLVPGGTYVALDVPSINLNSLPGRVQLLAHRLMATCSVNTSHRSLEAVEATFGKVQVRRYWFGMVFIAIGTKQRTG